MKFYDVLSEYYDVVFPYDIKKSEFLNGEFEDRVEILDAACGSGTYSMDLASKGKNVTAIDLDQKMIDLLNEKKSEGDSIKALCEDMTKVKELNKNFDGIFCIGNSLVHLPSKEKIGEFIKGCYKILNPGGKLIIQIINYDKILGEGLKGLPTIIRDQAGLKFHREYNYEESSNVEFRGRIVLENGEEYDNSVMLVPLLREDIEKYMEDFKAVHFYGGFDKSPWDMKKMPCVVVAEK